MTVRARLAPLLAVVGLVGSALSAHAAGPAAQSAHCVAPLGCGDDLREALDLETRMNDHLWYGLALPVDYNTADRLPGDIATVGPAWGDAGLWSGTYLAAESYRYAVARDRLHSGGQRAFWRDQREEAKARVDELLSQVDLRTQIARSWQTQQSPSVGSGTPPAVSFGGGVVPGEAGMLMFSCAPEQAPAGRGMPRNSDVRGPFVWHGVGRPARLAQPDGNYVCEASTTRDAYAGTFFGLLTAFDLVGPDDPSVRDLIRDDILAMADFLLKYGWNYAHPHGDVALPPFGDVYDNFLTPIMVISPNYRLGISQAAKHVAEVAGPADEKQKWQAVWQEELATQSPSDIIAGEVNDPTPTGGYYGLNLSHLIDSSLVRLAANPVERDMLVRDFSVIDRQTSDDNNAFFESVTFAMGGEAERRDKAITHLRQWRDYRARIDEGGVTDLTNQCGAALTCVPQDQWDLIVDGPSGELRTTIPGSSTTPRSVEPIPIKDRAPADFLWQRSPFTDLTGSVSATHEEPGIDYLLPYWMLRYNTEVSVPVLQPLPVWPGPRYSGT
ncbi:MAG: hypothetical protein ABR549_01130 [Mycobacteriales bacterium]